jgi:hypothetical protein
VEKAIRSRAADDTNDVLNVRVEIDRAVHQMSALVEAGQGRRILVPGLTADLGETSSSAEDGRP